MLTEIQPMQTPLATPHQIPPAADSDEATDVDSKDKVVEQGSVPSAGRNKTKKGAGSKVTAVDDAESAAVQNTSVVSAVPEPKKPSRVTRGVSTSSDKSFGSTNSPLILAPHLLQQSKPETLPPLVGSQKKADPESEPSSAQPEKGAVGKRTAAPARPKVGSKVKTKAAEEDVSQIRY